MDTATYLTVYSVAIFVLFSYKPDGQIFIMGDEWNVGKLFLRPCFSWPSFYFLNLAVMRDTLHHSILADYLKTLTKIKAKKEKSKEALESSRRRYTAPLKVLGSSKTQK